MPTAAGRWPGPPIRSPSTSDGPSTISSDDDSADDILTSQLRRGYVDLIDRTEIGDGDDAIRRYEMRLDTASFENNFPLQYQEYQDRAIPGVQSARGLVVTIALDADNVLTEVDDSGSNWSWQRLAYSDRPFTPDIVRSGRLDRDHRRNGRRLIALID